MIGNIKRPNPLKPFDPSSYFDPTTNTCTEADFIKILEKGVYDSNLIGKFVTLSNTVDYDGGKWVIADVNHDSENTGQTNCYDLISVDCFHNAVFNSSNNSQWRNSSIRTWLNNTFYNGFSNNFKARMINPKYNYYFGTSAWYTDDKIILPSFREVTTQYDNIVHDEGTTYPIFTDNNSRIKKYNSTAQIWFTRTYYGVGAVSAVYTSGGLVNVQPKYEYYSAPLMRVQ